jgi:hypothetical protein
MGEAKLKRRSHAAVLSGQPACIYCGGANVAATIEHMPPISVFRGRQRPKGLEFPACQACNHGTGRSDLVGALLARVWPDAGSEIQRADIVKLLRAVANNVPGLLEEMDVGRGAEKNRAKASQSRG